ncbi:MAG: ATP-binding protein [Halanaerobacter sp.]
MESMSFEILNKIDIGIIILNQEQKIVFWNKWLQELTDKSMSDVQNRKISEINSLFGTDIYQSFFADVLERKQSFFKSGVLNQIFIPTDREVKQNLQMKYVNLEGEPHILLEIFDITNQEKRVKHLKKEIKNRVETEKKLKEAKQKAEAANQAKSEFLANMSHEIRTPLNAVIGFSEMLEKIITENKKKNYLDSIKTAGQNLLTLINDILDLSKIEAGRLEIEYDYFDLENLINEIKQIFTQKVNNKDLNLTIDLEEDLPLIRLDDTRLRQILLNLIGNAVKFTDSGSIFITVKTENIDQQRLNLYLTVEDTGIGIPASQQDKIFDSFKQQNGSLNKEYEGTGLGLAITKRLTKMMDGEIDLESEVDVGSKFKLCFSEVKYAPKTNAKDESEEESETISFAPARLLVVDDIESNRDLIAAMIEDSNLTVETAVGGYEAVSLVREREFDLVFMDLKMPNLNGYQTLEKIKSDSKNQNLPIVALTASATQEEKNKVIEYDFADFITKPLCYQDFIEVLKEHLDYESVDNPNRVKYDLSLSLAEMPKSEVDALLKIFKEELIPEYKKLNEALIINEAENFANRLYDLALDYNLEELISYAELLQEYTDDFALDNVRYQLDKFEKIIKQLRAID